MNTGTIYQKLLKSKSDVEYEIKTYKDISKTIKSIIKENDKLIDDNNIYNKSLVLSNAIIMYIQSAIKNNFEAIITKAITTIFNDDLKFKIDIKYLRSQLEVDMYIEKDERRINLLNEGGGLISIITFLMKEILKQITQVNTLSIYDEAFARISNNYFYPFFKFIYDLNKTFKTQFIIVSHKGELINNKEHIDRIIRINKKKDGVFLIYEK